MFLQTEEFTDDAVYEFQQAVQLADKLREKGFDVPEGVYRIEEIKAVIEKIAGKGGPHA